jgi:hypothetical protein
MTRGGQQRRRVRTEGAGCSGRPSGPGPQAPPPDRGRAGGLRQRPDRHRALLPSARPDGAYRPRVLSRPVPPLPDTRRLRPGLCHRPRDRPPRPAPPPGIPGDDRIRERARGGAVPDSFTHGTSAQRGRCDPRRWGPRIRPPPSMNPPVPISETDRSGGARRRCTVALPRCHCRPRVWGRLSCVVYTQREERHIDLSLGPSAASEALLFRSPASHDARLFRGIRQERDGACLAEGTRRRDPRPWRNRRRAIPGTRSRPGMRGSAFEA